MIGRSAVLMAPLWLAACGGPSPAHAPLSPQEEACASQADQDPALQQARGIAASQPNWEFQHEPEMQQIKRDAITRCLKGRGLLPRGGVERPR